MMSKNLVNRRNISMGKNALYLKSIEKNVIKRSVELSRQLLLKNVGNMRIKKYNIFTQKVKNIFNATKHIMNYSFSYQKNIIILLGIRSTQYPSLSPYSEIFSSSC